MSYCVWNIEAEEFFNDLGNRISCSTGEAQETSFLYQRLFRRAVGCVVKVSAHGSEGRRFDTRLHQLSDW